MVNARNLINMMLEVLAYIGWLYVFKWYFKFASQSVFKWFLGIHGAKDGILVHSDWYHASKVHFLYLSIIW